MVKKLIVLLVLFIVGCSNQVNQTPLVNVKEEPIDVTTGIQLAAHIQGYITLVEDGKFEVVGYGNDFFGLNDAEISEWKKMTFTGDTTNLKVGTKVAVWAKEIEPKDLATVDIIEQIGLQKFDGATFLPEQAIALAIEQTNTTDQAVLAFTYESSADTWFITLKQISNEQTELVEIIDK